MIARARRLSGCVLLAALVGACGTTVPTGAAGGPLAARDGLGPTPAGATVLPGTPTTTDPVGTAPDAAGGTGATGRVPSGATTGTSVVPARPGTGALPVSGRGFDAKHVYIGIPVQTDVNAGAAALGFTNVDFGDQLGQVKAVIADVNARGGLLGRTVVAVIRDVKTADLVKDAVTEAQSACTQFTQDRPVIGVVNLLSAFDREAFYGCLARKQTPVLSAGLALVDDAFMAKFSPYLYKTCCPSMDQLMPIWLSRLVAQKYFSGWNTTLGAAGTAPTKVGLLYGLDPATRDFAKIATWLKGHGYDVAATFQYGSQSDMSSAVLKFRDAGVTHVIADNGGVYYFMQTAESQHYRPRYGLSSYMGTYVALVTLGAAPGQLAGSLGVGWMPVDDVAESEDPGDVVPGEARCQNAMRKGGQTNISKRSVQHQAYNFCDGIYLLVEAAAAGRGLDAQAIRLGAKALGNGFTSALTFRTGLTFEHLYLPGAVRDLGYDSACSCFRYLSSRLYSW